MSEGILGYDEIYVVNLYKADVLCGVQIHGLMANKRRIRKVPDGGPIENRPKPLVVKRRYEILERLLAGQATNDIYKDIILTYNIHHREVDNDFKIVREQIRQSITEEKENIINLHIIRYEELYQELMNMSLHATAMKVLENKEKLIGLHSGDINIQVNNVENTAVVKSVETFNYQNLNKQEQERLNLLLSKCQK